MPDLRPDFGREGGKKMRSGLCDSRKSYLHVCCLVEGFGRTNELLKMDLNLRIHPAFNNLGVRGIER